MEHDKLINNIEKYSKEKGVSKTKALIDSGVGKDFIINIVKKGTVPSISKLEQLANYFNVSVDALLGKSEQNEKPLAVNGLELSEEEYNLIEALRSLSPEEQKLIYRAAGIEFLDTNL